MIYLSVSGRCSCFTESISLRSRYLSSSCVLLLYCIVCELISDNCMYLNLKCESYSEGMLTLNFCCSVFNSGQSEEIPQRACLDFGDWLEIYLNSESHN